MKTLSIVGTSLLCLFFCGLIFAQGTTGTLTGTVEDSSKALLPGVTITATNNNTGISNTQITNESGAYTMPALLPGVYTLKASLPGFQTHTVNNIDLGSETKRFNFTMLVAGLATNVDVAIDATALLTTSGANIGEVLSARRVTELPLVTGDVLDLVKILPGVRISGAGGGFDTFAGLSANTVNTSRDGLSVTDGRYMNGIFASSTINPDLVGEIRLILTPVDAEMGRGNGQVQITTRSGTNRYSGAAVWNLRNTALNANTWGNNNDQVTENGVTRWKPTPLDWSNENQMTVSFGGPIIKNKTFFFALWDRNLHNQRQLVTGTVLTDTARNGVFRYWEGWNSGNASQSNPADGSSSNVIATVDFGGNPVRPFRAQGAAGGPYTGNLRCFSVFGTTKADGSPFTANDCAFGSVVGVPVFPNGGAASFDSVRPVMDQTGFIRKFLESMPHANYWETGDGLNTAGIRWLQGKNANSGGLNTSSLQTGQNIGADRTQWNFKVDQNFTSEHKAAVGFSWERSGGADFLTNWPNTLPGETQRHSFILTSNFTSTLSATLLNEARFGIRTTRTASNAAWDNADSSIADATREFFLNGSPSLFSSDPTPMPVIFNPGSGNMQFGGGTTGQTPVSAPFSTTAVYLGNRNPLYNFADTVRWTRGAHALRMGGEYRMTRSNGYNFLPYNLPRLTGGAGNHTATAIAPQSTGNPTGIPGLLSSSTSTTITATESSARNLLYMLAGSINSGNVGYWINSPDDVTNAKWEDFITERYKYRDQRANEWSAFFQDDWKVTRDLTLNLGMRYEYYAPPYLKGGFTSSAIGQGDGLFGVGGGTDLYSTWLQPGNVFLTNYGGTVAGQTASSLLQCVSGVRQNSNLPFSSCDPNKLTTLEFIGPDSSNPQKSVIRPDRNNFGPVFGFAWSVPWFGEGKTTLRGGYSVTYGGPGRDGISLDGVLGGAPGASNSPSISITSFTNADGTLDYLDLSDIPKLVPITPTLAPGGSFPIYQNSSTFTAYSPSFVTPYTQNLNLSVQRTLTRLLSLEVKYVGTRGLKLQGTQNLNDSNVFSNPELFQALEITRAGGDAPLFDQMFAGLNLNPGVSGGTGKGSYGPVGTVNSAGVLQTGSMHLRRWQGSDLANGEYADIADAITGNLPTGNTGAVAVPSTVTVGQRILRNGCDRLAVGTPVGTAPIGQVQTSAGLMPIRCFPENWILMNPQMDNPNYIANYGKSNYHSLQTQLVMRPVKGISLTGTYTWSRNLTLQNNDYKDLRDRDADYALSTNNLQHDLRINGTVELPIGPNKLFFGNSSGWVARVLERWQASFIFQGYSGRPSSVEGAQSLWNGDGIDIVGPFPVHGGEVEWGTIVSSTTTGQLGGTYFGSPNPFTKVSDPACAAGGLTDVTDAMGWNLRGNLGNTGSFNQLCTNDALANASTGQILLQNARPGQRGTYGVRTISRPGVWNFDASMSKTFQLTESKSLQVRMDATNVLNHPAPPTPEFDINDNTLFGNITGDKTGNRSFKASLRLAF
jgi:hypothetical protein